MTAIAQAGAALLGGRLARAAPLAGGDLSSLFRITLEDGRHAVVKGGPMVRHEAVMLGKLAAVPVPTPAVLAVDDGILVLEERPADGGPAWADLGTVLARLHGVRGAAYGWDAAYAFGPLPIANGWSRDWPAFWAEHRLRTHLPYVPAALARRLDGLAAGLGQSLPRQPPPVLLHGDLWAGNILTATGRVSGLIDPACYFGHCEVDLAMLALFDRPAAAFADRYGAPEAGAAARRPIYQLWPALVHLRLFGAGYRGLVERLLGAAGV